MIKSAVVMGSSVNDRVSHSLSGWQKSMTASILLMNITSFYFPNTIGYVGLFSVR
jgi:hypothetical protein